MNEKRRTNIWLSVLAVVGLLLFLIFSWNDSSLTEESHFIKHDAAIARASDVLKEQGVSVQGWEAQAILDGNSAVDGYLSKNDLHDSFDQKAPATAPLTYWKVTFIEPSGNTNHTVELDAVSGKSIGLDLMPSSAPTALSQSKALLIAKAALAQEGVPVSRLLVSGGELQTIHANLPSKRAASSASPPTFERKFSFADPAFRVGELKLHYDVTVGGSRVKSLQAVYDLPTSFTDWRDKQKLLGGLLAVLSVVLTFVMFVLALVFLFLIKQRKPYRGAVWLSVLVFVLFLFSNLNELPVLLNSMLGASSGVLERMVSNVLVVIILVVLTVLVAGGTFPMILTGGMLTEELGRPQLWTSWQSPDFGARIRQAMWRGYLLAVTWLGFQDVFYWVAQTYFGVYAESDYTMSPSNMWVPALLPLMGWLAGVQEEMTYRLFGINFIKRYWKNTFLALLLPAMVWALGHSTYAVFPVYTRFIELTIFGVAIGWCYLKFGIETTIFAHAIFDITQMCIPLVVSGVASQQAAGLIFFVSPIVVAYGLGLLQPRRKKILQNDNIV